MRGETQKLSDSHKLKNCAMFCTTVSRRYIFQQRWYFMHYQYLVKGQRSSFLCRLEPFLALLTKGRKALVIALSGVRLSGCPVVRLSGRPVVRLSVNTLVARFDTDNPRTFQFSMATP